MAEPTVAERAAEVLAEAYEPGHGVTAHDLQAAQALADAGLLVHECDSGHFDRVVCPEPCGVMHSYCTVCGRRVDPCAHDGEVEHG
jgi:hypothetical protein